MQISISVQSLLLCKYISVTKMYEAITLTVPHIMPKQFAISREYNKNTTSLQNTSILNTTIIW